MLKVGVDFQRSVLMDAYDSFEFVYIEDIPAGMVSVSEKVSILVWM